MPLSHHELALIAAAAYKGPWSDLVDGDVKCDFLPRAGELVVAVPGTDPQNAQDLLRDASAWPTHIPGLGMVHAGFGNGAAALRAKINPLIGRQWPLVTYVGHSLGGAVAENLAAWHAISREGQPFRVVVFGCPRVAWVNLGFPWLLRRGIEAVEYRNAGDPIVSVPPRSLGYLHGASGQTLGHALPFLLSNHAASLYADRVAT